MTEIDILDLANPGAVLGVVIDVRTPAEFASGHVKGAKNLPVDKISKSELERLSQGAPVRLMCRSGSRSRMALEKAIGSGFQGEVTCINGGIETWLKAGLPVETLSHRKVIPLERQVRIAAGLLVAVGSLLALCISSNWIFLPLFVGCGLIFAGITDWCGMAILLAKMPWNRS